VVVVVALCVAAGDKRPDENRIRIANDKRLDFASRDASKIFLLVLPHADSDGSEKNFLALRAATEAFFKVLIASPNLLDF